LPMVDVDQIGLEGHSMGGWTVLAAAAAMPNAYASMVLEGSSTGAPFAQEGSPNWPRNAAAKGIRPAD
jgi:pimeloyl-ACP methyl ester carboxylesterase